MCTNRDADETERERERDRETRNELYIHGGHCNDMSGEMDGNKTSRERGSHVNDSGTGMESRNKRMEHMEE